MSYVARQSDFATHAIPSTAPAAVPGRPSVWRRLYDAMMLSRERQTQRDIDRLVRWRDGRFNDAFEREIAERFYSDGWNVRR